MTRSVLINPLAPESGRIAGVTAQEAGWTFLNMEVKRLQKGERWQHFTAQNEMAIVVLGGVCSVSSNKGEWAEIGRREDVFSGMPYALYLSRETKFELAVLSTTLEIACCWVQADTEFPSRLITPQDSAIEIRGGHNATRQINGIIPPGFPCDKLVCVEVYTPGGNWSSYPPHKHDEHKLDAAGNLIEGDLEEIYFYKFKRKEGYAVQRVYTSTGSLNECAVARDNSIVLVPEGYHPVCTAYGYDCYYLNFLAGSAQTLACTFDPDYSWTMDTWDQKILACPWFTTKWSQP